MELLYIRRPRLYRTLPPMNLNAQRPKRKIGTSIFLHVHLHTRTIQIAVERSHGIRVKPDPRGLNRPISEGGLAAASDGGDGVAGWNATTG